MSTRKTISSLYGHNKKNFHKQISINDKVKHFCYSSGKNEIKLYTIIHSVENGVH